MRLILLLLFVLVPFESYTFSSEKLGSTTGLSIPRFVTLKSKDVNMRSGPGINYPMKINYKCYNLPLKIISESESWRLVRDSRGNEGWIHEAMIDKKDYVEIISDAKVAMFRLPNERSKQTGYVESGVLAKLLKCNENWCKIILAKKYQGWIQKRYLWGLDV